MHFKIYCHTFDAAALTDENVQRWTRLRGDLK